MGHFHAKKKNEINILFNGRSKTRQPLTLVGSEEKTAWRCKWDCMAALEHCQQYQSYQSISKLHEPPPYIN